MKLVISRRSLALLLLTLCLLLSGCSSQPTAAVPTLPPLVQGNPQGTVQNIASAPEAAQTNEEVPAAPAIQTSRQQTASGVLTDGVQFIFYQDGELVLTGAPLTAQLRSETMLLPHLDKITRITF